MALTITENVSLTPLTTIGLGGLARYLVEGASHEELREAITWAQERELPIHILGGGSNTIFQDEGFDGFVIHINLKGIAFGEGGLTTVAAGEEWDPFVAECVERGLAGVECLSGIPGRVGATPIQNVGAYGQEVAQTITEVRALNAVTLEEKIFSNQKCEFGYRWSRFKGKDAGKYVITQVTFQLTVGGEVNVSYQQVKEELERHFTPVKSRRGITGHATSLRSVRDIVLGLRKKKSMVVDPADPNTRSCGSFFENLQLSAGELRRLQARVRDAGGSQVVPTFQEAGVTRVPTAWLIEQAGFPKGFRRGGAGISTNHNLALVNYGGTTEELLSLADDIGAAVQEKFGIRLTREPVVVS